MIPDVVREHLTHALRTLREYRTSLDRYRRFGARYEAEIADARGEEAAEASAVVDEFLRLAAVNRVDGPGVIADLGGRASTELSAEGAEWLREMRESRREREATDDQARASVGDGGRS